MNLNSLRMFFVEEREDLAHSVVEQASVKCEENGIIVQERIRERKQMRGETAENCILTMKQEYERKVKEIIDAIVQEINIRFTQIHELDDDFGLFCSARLLLEEPTDELKVRFVNSCKD